MGFSQVRQRLARFLNCSGRKAVMKYSKKQCEGYGGFKTAVPFAL
jgi:hypothetical protein